MEAFMKSDWDYFKKIERYISFREYRTKKNVAICNQDFQFCIGSHTCDMPNNKK